MQHVVKADEPQVAPTPEARAGNQKAWTGSRWLLGLTSLGFIVLQSACTAFMALSGLQLLIGIGSLAAASAGLKFLDAIHGNVFRIPMTILAAAGSLLNLYAIWRVRSLRARPASQWRMTKPEPAKIRSERIQVGLSLLTLVLVAAEWAAHIHLFGRF
jgi:hypothetical protein